MIAQLQTQTMDPQLSSEEYLAWEVEQDGKYEYENGAVLAMTGGSLNHNEGALALIVLLRNHLRGRGYRILGSDAKLAIDSHLYYYPDVVVSCDERDRNAHDYLEYPCFIAEIISPSTEARDRGIKQQNYMRIPTLKAYFLVDPEKFQVELYQRQEGSWSYVLVSGLERNVENPKIQIACFNLEFSLSILYENIDFT